MKPKCKRVFQPTILLIIISARFASCSGDKTALKPRSPWDESLVEFFDDSIDFTMDPQSLSGQWLYDYQNHLKMRMKKSEIVMAIKILSMTLKTDPEGRQCKDLYAQIKTIVKGSYPSSNITLRVCDNSMGFDSFKEDDRRIFDRIHVAFIKLYRRASGQVAMHWHLSPLSEGLKEGMDKIIEESKKERTEKKKEIFIYKSNNTQETVK